MTKRVIYVTTYDPIRQDLGGASWVDNVILEELSRSAVVSLFVVCDPTVASPVPLEVKTWGKAFRTLAAMTLRGWPYQRAKFASAPGWRQRAQELKDLTRDDDVKVVTSQWPALLLAKEAGVAVHTHVAHNVDTVLARTYDPLPFKLMGNAKRMGQLESRLLREVASLWMLSQSDVNRAEQWNISSKHLSLIPEINLTRAKSAYGLGFIGKASWPPNEAAIETLIHEIMPKVRRQLGPESPSLLLAGRGTDKWRGSEGVKALGRVDNLREFYDSVDLVVVPRLGTSTGISVKMVEAVSMGVVVVVPEGLAKDAGLTHNFIGAESTDKMVEAIVKFYRAESQEPAVVESPILPSPSGLREFISSIASESVERIEKRLA